MHLWGSSKRKFLIALLLLGFLMSANWPNGFQNYEFLSKNAPTPNSGDFPQPSALLGAFKTVDLRSWGLSHEEKFLASSLEGLINKNGDLLYFIWAEWSFSWIDEVNTTQFAITDSGISSLQELCETYHELVEGLIVFDSQNESANVATPLSGIFNSILVHSSLLSVIQGYTNYGSKPIVANITAEYQAQGFTPKSDRGVIYRWAFEKWFKQCNQTALALLSAGISTHLRSFLCMNSIFTIWQPFLIERDDHPIDNEVDRAFFTYMLQNTPQNMITYGYMFPDGANEHPVVRALSENGKYLVPSDFSANLPFFHHLPIPEGYEFKQNRNVQKVEDRKSVV